MSDPSDADKQAAQRVVAATPQDHKAVDRLLGRWSSPWLAPNEERVVIAIHPLVRTELNQLLGNDPAAHGMGYSEFIMRAIRQWEIDHA